MPKFVPPMPLVIFRQLKLPGFYPLGGTKGLYLRIRGASEIYILRYIRKSALHVSWTP